MKVLYSLLGIGVLVLQYQLWLGEDSLRDLRLLQQELQEQELINARLESRNQRLEVEVLDLKNGSEAVEERARSELGMIGQEETFYLIVE